MTAAPLRGLRVVITRAAHQAGELGAAFEAVGAEVAYLPLLEVTPPADPAPLERAAAEVAAFDRLVFTSSNAVDAFLPRVVEEGGTAAGIAALPPVATVGPATSRALRAFGVEPALEATESRGAGLAAELLRHLEPGDRVLVPQAEDARPELAAALRRGGCRVTAVTAYAKWLPPGARADAERLFAAGPIGWVTFTSPRIVRHFLDLLAELFAVAAGDDPEAVAREARRRGLRTLSIGPTTTAELARRGLTPDAEAARPGVAGMVAAWVAAVSG
jgi:uroporphyrinogen III methyltransferase/synthase